MPPRARSAPTSPTRSTPTPCTARTRSRTPRSKSRTSSQPPTSTRAERLAIKVIETNAVNVISAKQNLLELDREGLENFFADTLGEKRFRAHQVMKWIHHRYVTDFAEMTDLGKALRAKLEEAAEIVVPKVQFE